MPRLVTKSMEMLDSNSCEVKPLTCMRICHIGWAQSIHIERWMRWFALRGHEIHIITDQPKDIEGVVAHSIAFEHDRRPRIVRYRDLNFNIWWWSHLRKIFEVRRLVRKIKPNILHSHSLWYPGYTGAFVGFKPFVVTVLDGDVIWVKDAGILQRIRTLYALKRADLVTGESRYLIDSVVKKGVSREKAVVIHPGVNLEIFRPLGSAEQVDLKRRLGIDFRYMVLSPRSLGQIYNIEKIVDIIPAVVEKCPECGFVFIWHSSQGQEMLFKEKLARAGVLHHVKFVGKIPHDQVAQYHQVSDVMISIAQNDSGPIAMVEAMACGAVPLITDLPSVREWVEHGKNGILVCPDDIGSIERSLVDLLGDHDYREEMRLRNLEIVRSKGDENIYMKRMEKMYFDLLRDRIHGELDG